MAWRGEARRGLAWAPAEHDRALEHGRASEHGRAAEDGPLTVGATHAPDRAAEASATAADGRAEESVPPAEEGRVAEDSVALGEPGVADGGLVPNRAERVSVSASEWSAADVPVAAEVPSEAREPG